jgi:signal transduction histidine kinase
MWAGLRQGVRQTHPVLFDAGAAVLLTGIMLATDVAARTDPITIGLSVLAVLPLAARRSAPMTVLVVCAIALVGYEGYGHRLGLQLLGAQLALLSLANRRPLPWTVVGAALLAPGVLYGNLRTPNASVFAVVVLSLAWIATICVAGSASRRLGEHDAVVADDAVRQRGEQHDREQQAVLLERVHIARELHDVVAHHMSVIAVQAGLARYVMSTDPETSQRALHAVAEMSSEGLAEVRRLVTVLRPDQVDGDTEWDQDTPGIDQLPILIERVGLTGVAIEFTVSGLTQPLPAGVELCLYRVVQESLTNAIKHARGARVTVLLDYEPNQVTLRITNDGRGSTGQPAREIQPSGGGKGLTGMYERAMLYGGTLTAGALPHGGFEVVLTLPRRAGLPGQPIRP